MNNRIKILLLIGLILPLTTIAKEKSSTNIIEMVSYEQSWLDTEGTLALKNNSNEDIYNVQFQITYLDMSGEPLDYEIYSRQVNIAPGMTKKVDIPAYEHDRHYSYYKSEATPFEPHRFKIKFDLKGYNTAQKDISEKNDFGEFYEDSSPITSPHNYGIFIIIAIVAAIFVIGISIGLYVLVALMAQKRNRSVVLWVMLSLFATPVIIIIILLFVGKSDKENRIFG